MTDKRSMPLSANGTKVADLLSRLEKRGISKAETRRIVRVHLEKKIEEGLTVSDRTLGRMIEAAQA
jgi:hypothetical protein